MSSKTIPQVKGQFLLGSLTEFKADPFLALTDWQRDYGDIVGFKVVAQQFYLFSHPQLVEQALIKQNDVFVKMYDAEKPKGLAILLGQGLVTSQGAFWRRQRRIIQPVFQRSNLSAMLPQMTTAGHHILERWRQLEDGAQLNLADEMMQLALEVITQTMFSTSMLNNIDKIAPALDIGLRYAVKTVANPLTLPLIFPTPANRQFKQARGVLDNVIYGLIEQRRTQSNAPNDLLTMLLNACDTETGEKMTDQQIRDEVITIFTAGHETTANLLTWTLYLLAKHPEVLTKLQAELNGLQGKTPDEKALQQLPYTLAILNESLRIRPPVGFIMRQINKDTKIDGYSLKANSLAIFSIYNIHHHPDFWENPEQFNPDRFLNNENRRFSFMPFGTGERVCIGNHFALMESQLLLAMVVQHYEVLLLNKEDAKIEMAVSLRPKGGIPVQLKRRSS